MFCLEKGCGIIRAGHRRKEGMRYASIPNPRLAEKDGLLAVGGDLSVERLLLGYSNGIFPWYNPGEEIMWWCPKERFLIFPDKIHVSHSMKKHIKRHMR